MILIAIAVAIVIIFTPYFLLPVSFDIEDFCLLIKVRLLCLCVQIP
ncbi:MAG: hypothetical protein F6J90_41515 [Moorea sp. SIOASIH]|nr:hypothetical protein [Moorena sp. SIOASIH]